DTGSPVRSRGRRSRACDETSRPILLRFTLHRRCIRVLHFEPIGRAYRAARQNENPARAHCEPGILVAVVTGNFLHEHHDPAPQAALSIRMNAPISLKPFESEMKSSIWATDNAVPSEPCGADA